MTSAAAKSLSVNDTRQGIAVVTIDMPGSSANVLTTQLFAELDETFVDLQQRTDLKGLILVSAKPTIFVAGADLKRIEATLDWPDSEIIKFCEDGRAVMSRLNNMPFTTVAAIHGACVGGGLEITLWCDRRIASDDRKTIMGLPEVKLGLVPGWAGTVRLPRIADLESAVDLVTSGRVVKAEQAQAMGFVDQTVAHEDLIECAAALIENTTSESRDEIREAVAGPAKRTVDIEQIRGKYATRIQENSSIYPFACNVVLEHMLSTASLPHDDACRGESLAMAQVYGSDPSYGLINNFFLAEHNRKNPGFVDLKIKNKDISTVGIVGTGLMGISIANICLKAGHSLVLFDASEDALAAAKKLLSEKSTGPKVQFAADYNAFAACDLVVESVVEVTDVKKSVIEKIEAAVPDDTIIATNTSAIPLSKIASALEHPGRFCGIHFCHPELMQLVEVVRGESSSAETMANGAAWVRKLRMMPVVVRDHAGFVVNRLLAAMLDQAFRLYSWGFSIQQIDQAMREFGFLAGPFEIVDIIGVDICMYAGREMYDGSVQCVTLSPILPRMVKKGWLGRKSGRGFYRYESTGGQRIWNDEINQLLASYVDTASLAEINDEQIAASVCSCIVLEATRILDDGIVADPRDIDLCIINGFSFPAHVGGILFWADRLGAATVNATLNTLAQSGSKLTPSPRLKQMEQEASTFYC